MDPIYAIFSVQTEYEQDYEFICYANLTLF